MVKKAYPKARKNILTDDSWLLQQLRILGNNIRKLRKYYKITQAELSTDILLGAANNGLISCKERCTTNKVQKSIAYFTTIDLLLISKHFNVSIDDLFNGNFPGGKDDN